MGGTLILYNLPSGILNQSNLERVINFLSSVISVNKTYSDLGVRALIPDSISVHNLGVYFEGKNFNAALEEIMQLCGVPDFVQGDYDNVEKVLKKYNKRLKRKFAGAGIGKYVVDL